MYYFRLGAVSCFPSTVYAGDWYEIARETFAELGVDQESIYAVLEATHNVSMHWVE